MARYCEICGEPLRSRKKYCYTCRQTYDKIPWRDREFNKKIDKWSTQQNESYGYSGYKRHRTGRYYSREFDKLSKNPVFMAIALAVVFFMIGGFMFEMGGGEKIIGIFLFFLGGIMVFALMFRSFKKLGGEFKQKKDSYFVKKIRGTTAGKIIGTILLMPVVFIFSYSIVVLIFFVVFKIEMEIITMTIISSILTLFISFLILRKVLKKR